MRFQYYYFDNLTFQVPDGGARAFPTNRYALQIIEITKRIGAQSPENCAMHYAPLCVYCNDCQVMICSTCIQVRKHRNHDIVDIPEKADEIKGELRQLKDITLGNDKAKLLKVEKRIQEITDEVNSAASEAVDRIETTMKHLLSGYRKAIEDVQAQAKEQRDIVIQTQQKHLKSLQDTRNDMEKRKGQLNECALLITQFVENENPKDIVSNYAAIRDCYAQANAEENRYNIWIKSYETVHFTQGQDQIPKPYVGTLSKVGNFVDYINLDMPEVWSPREAEFVSFVKSLKTDGRVRGTIYVGRIREVFKIRAFDASGEIIFEGLGREHLHHLRHLLTSGEAIDRVILTYRSYTPISTEFLFAIV